MADPTRRSTAFIFAGTLVFYAYGSIEHSVNRGSDVWAYHRYWPPNDCEIEIAGGANPLHHPTFCLAHLEANVTYAERGRRDGPIQPYATSTSLVYLLAALVLVHYERRYHLFDVGGVALSLAWVAAGSLNLHYTQTTYASKSDWHVIGPLLAWAGVDLYGLPSMWMAYACKLAVVSVAIFWGYENHNTVVYYGGAILGVGYYVVYHGRLAYAKELTTAHVLDAALTLFVFYTAMVVKTCASSADAMFESVASVLPAHGYGIRAKCLNDVDAARIQDITHGTWHVCALTGLWIIVLRSFDAIPFDAWWRRVPVLINMCMLLIAAYQDVSYEAWMGIVYSGLILETIGMLLPPRATPYAAVPKAFM